MVCCTSLGSRALEPKLKAAVATVACNSVSPKILTIVTCAPRWKAFTLISALAMLSLLKLGLWSQQSELSPCRSGEGGWKSFPQYTQQHLRHPAIRVHHLFFIEKGEELL